MIADGTVFDRPDMATVDTDVGRAQLGFNTSASTCRGADDRQQPTGWNRRSRSTPRSCRWRPVATALGSPSAPTTASWSTTGSAASSAAASRGAPCAAPSITPADQLFVSSLGGELTLYDLDTLQPIRTFGGSRGFVQLPRPAPPTGRSSPRKAATGKSSCTTWRPAPASATPSPSATTNRTLPHCHPTARSSPSVAAPTPASRSGTSTRSTGSTRHVGSPAATSPRDEWDTNIGHLAHYHTTCPGLPVPTAAVSSKD